MVWIDGGREEVALMFSRSETSRSINWRELLGIVRIFEHFGHRLAGRVVLVETDNMAAEGAASKMSSSSEDMQELIRRLLEAAVRHGIVLRFTHTPGVKLIRPDQTSRLSSELFSLLSSRFGPFSEMMGAEREFERASGSAPRIWMHPTYSTVASALRMLGERMGRGDAASGVVVVPDDSSAAWWKLTRHFRVVGRIERGSGGRPEFLPGEAAQVGVAPILMARARDSLSASKLKSRFARSLHTAGLPAVVEVAGE